jgi:two-component system, OmpR family, response regulator
MNTKIRVLIAEDDPFIGMITKECFETRGFEVCLCEDGNEAFKQYQVFKPNICIFDVMMPFKDGFTLAEEIRAIDQKIPILFLTAKSLKEDVIKGFKIGADDYVKKPFSVEELIARVDAVLRRSGANPDIEDEQSIFQIGDLSFDSDFQILKTLKEEIKLTDKESGILAELCRNQDQITERSTLLIKVWGDDSFFNSRSLDVYITKLRKYLKNDMNIELVTVRGKGFKLWAGNKKAFDN